VRRLSFSTKNIQVKYYDETITNPNRSGDTKAGDLCNVIECRGSNSTLDPVFEIRGPVQSSGNKSTLFESTALMNGSGEKWAQLLAEKCD
jgi:hypothetical protein